MSFFNVTRFIVPIVYLYHSQLLVFVLLLPSSIVNTKTTGTYKMKMLLEL